MDIDLQRRFRHLHQYAVAEDDGGRDGEDFK